MRGKLLFVAGAATGYVLGTRAGRKRYEQIREATSRLWQTPGIQKQVRQAEDFAAQKIGDVPGVVLDGVKKVVASASKRKSGTRETGPKKSVSSKPGSSPDSFDSE